LLLAVDPSREGHEEHLQGVDIGRHGPIAHSGHREQPDRSMVNAPIGDRDRSGATLGVGG
jgi:hypothetical protein